MTQRDRTPGRTDDMQQPDLFGAPPDDVALASTVAEPPSLAKGRLVVPPADPDEAVLALAASLRQCFGDRLYLGTSSWYFPGWAGMVWAPGRHEQSDLSRHGLVAYAQHPLLRTVSLDRTFYRAIDAATYARHARQVPDDFRFLVKVPSEITDATLREPESGAPVAPNPHFLDAERALDTTIRPALSGLGAKLGAFVFQLPPLGWQWLKEPRVLTDKLDALWSALMPALPPGALAALELRDARVMTPALLEHLAAHGVRYCVGLHDRMPTMAEQAQLMRAAGAGDFVCRWNLHQGLRYRQAKERWEPFDRLQAPDPDTREALARAVVAALADGHRAFVTINNKAEGCAPLSVVELARAILRHATERS
jgi:uncharacterized protein YecE (DUF72 family)